MTRNNDRTHTGTRAAPEPRGAATEYEPCEDLCVVAVHYNPCRYESRSKNLQLFLDSLRRSGLSHVVAECAFGDDAWELPADPWIRHFRSRDVLWQKERLINTVVRSLPRHIQKIAWLDGDILFCEPDWARRTSQLLESFPIVQCFSHAARLAPGEMAPAPDAQVVESFAAVLRRSPRVHMDGVYDAHGHTGFAWAARRELVESRGLYDAHVASNGDHLMAHAIVGDVASGCVDQMLCGNPALTRHFRRWATGLYRDVRGRLGCVDGTLLHLWHGSPANRRHGENARDLAAIGFDPVRDLRPGEDGCWEWASDHPRLHRWAAEFFARRREDEPEAIDVGPSATSLST